MTDLAPGHTPAAGEFHHLRDLLARAADGLAQALHLGDRDLDWWSRSLGLSIGSPHDLARVGLVLRLAGCGSDLLPPEVDRWPLPPALGPLFHRVVIDRARAGEDALGGMILDGAKNLVRRRLGQHFTPPVVADLALAHVLPRGSNPTGAILDPSCGSGSFLLRASTRSDRGTLLGVERSPALACLARANLSHRGHHAHEVLCRDFFDLPLPGPGGRDPVDGLIGNPPYTRQESLGPGKAGLLDACRALVPDLSGRTSLHGLFLVRAGHWLREGARLGLVLFDSWLDVAYGGPIRRFLLERFQVHGVVWSRVERWFPDADVPTCLLLATRTDSPDPERPVVFAGLDLPVAEAVRRAGGPDRLLDALLGGGRCEMATVAEIMPRDLGGGPWGRVARAPDLARRLTEASTRLDRSGLVLRRGLTTGANSFFYLSLRSRGREVSVVEDSTGRTMELESRCLRPLMKSLRGLDSRVVRAEDLPTVVLRVPPGPFPPKVAGYLARGEAEPFPSRSRAVIPAHTTTCSGRRPWYGLPRLPSPSMVLPKRIGRRFFVPVIHGDAVEDQALYGLLVPDSQVDLVAGLLNSSVARFLFEILSYDLTGSISVAELNVHTAQAFPLPGLRHMDPGLAREIAAAFGRLASAPVLDLAHTVETRQAEALDLLTLRAYGVQSREAAKLLDWMYSWLIDVQSRRDLKGSVTL